MPPYNRNPPKKSRHPDMVRLDSLLPELSERMGLNQKTAEFAVLALWPVVLDRLGLEALRLRSKAYKLSVQAGVTTLRVRVSDAASASDCSFVVDTIKVALNQFSAQTSITVDKIQVRIGG
jgi:hypothetical protein